MRCSRPPGLRRRLPEQFRSTLTPCSADGRRHGQALSPVSAPTRSSSRDAIKSAPGRVPSPSRTTSALRRLGGFYAYGPCKSFRRTNASRLAGSISSDALPPSTRAATCASTTRSPPPTHQSNAPGSPSSSASFSTLHTHSVRTRRASSNDCTCPTAQAAARHRERVRPHLEAVVSPMRRRFGSVVGQRQRHRDRRAAARRADDEECAARRLGAVP